MTQTLGNYTEKIFKYCILYFIIFCLSIDQIKFGFIAACRDNTVGTGIQQLEVRFETNLCNNAFKGTLTRKKCVN
jgi:hypothetical protein